MCNRAIFHWKYLFQALDSSEIYFGSCTSVKSGAMVVDDTATPTEGKEEEEEEEEGVRSGGGWVDSSSLQTAGRPAREESGRCWGFSPRSINVDPPSSPLLPTC